MVILNSTKIVPLLVFNCAVTSELRNLGDWPTVHRDDDSLGARELITRKIEKNN